MPGWGISNPLDLILRRASLSGRPPTEGWGISSPSIPYPPDRVVVGEVRGAEVPRSRVARVVGGAVHPADGGVSAPPEIECSGRGQARSNPARRVAVG